MALVTGKDCDLTIAAKAYAGVVNTYELAFDMEASEYQTLAGPLAAPGAETGTLTITAAYDSGETDSLYDALWDAAVAGTAIAYVATVGASTFTGSAVAKRPGANAVAGEVSEFTVDLALDGMPVKAPKVAVQSSAK